MYERENCIILVVFFFFGSWIWYFLEMCVRVCVMLYIKMFKALPALDKQNEKKIEILRRKKETFFFLSSTKINLKRFFPILN